jgi:hypothetical protein
MASSPNPERHMTQPIPSRRQFMTAVGNLASAGWIAMNWPQIALAADHSGHAGHAEGGPPRTLKTLSAAEAAEVDAIANQIVPGGATPRRARRQGHPLHRQRARPEDREPPHGKEERRLVDLVQPSGLHGIRGRREWLARAEPGRIGRLEFGQTAPESGQLGGEETAKRGEI